MEGDTSLINALVEHGPIGILALALLYAVVVLWRKNNTLHEEIGKIQQARLGELERVVKALSESTSTVAAISEVISNRKGRSS